jgi:endonuclease-3
MTKKQKARLVCERLAEIYPEAECALQFGGEPWRLLVMARLSAQCTDARVNLVSRELFKAFPTAESMAAAELSEIEEIIKPCGLYRMKAKNLKEASDILIKEYGGELPRDMDELLKLPGVGRKTANLILGDIFGVPGSTVVDTHCIRLSNRMGLVDNIKEPVKIEMELRKILPPEKSSDFCHRLVLHGRAVCTARKPMCENCCCRHFCQSFSG